MKMPAIGCPFEDCEYTTPDVHQVLVAAFITANVTVHGSTKIGATLAGAESVKWRHISSFARQRISRWSDM